MVKKWQKLMLAVSVLVAGFVGGLVAHERTAHAINVAAVDTAPVWSASSSDVLAIDGLNAIVVDMDKQLAPIVSDSQTRASVIQFLGNRWRYFEAGNKSLMESAAEQHHLPTGQRVYFDPSRIAWVATSSQ